MRAGDAATIVRERVRQAGPEPIDRDNGGLVDWPGGNGPYLYGGFFHDYLVSRFGERKLGELIERQARRVHYFGSGAYEAVFGASLGRLWRDFMTSVEPASVPGGTVAPASPPAASARLTHHGFFVGSPRFAPDGASLFYTLQTPHRFPSIMRLDGAGASPQPMATQYGSEGITVGSDLVVFDQLELDASVALRADLYVVAAGGGRPRRLTENERLLQPALSPDGRSLAAVRLTGGARNLAWFDVERSPDGAMRVKERPGPDGGGQAGSPRWSPDGRQLAFERRITGGASEIVLLDLDGHSARVLASARTCRLVTPAWTPDGRAVVFASDQPAVPASDVLARSFQLYIVPAAGGSVRRLTAVPGGATSPAISPDGRRVVFVGYSEDGADLFEMPFDPGGAVEADWPPPPATPPPASAAETGAGVPANADDRSYSPLNTLLPRAWVPVADTTGDTLRLGVATGSVDVLGRHAWGAMLRWRVGSEHEAVSGAHGGRPDLERGVHLRPLAHTVLRLGLRRDVVPDGADRGGRPAARRGAARAEPQRRPDAADRAGAAHPPVAGRLQLRATHVAGDQRRGAADLPAARDRSGMAAGLGAPVSATRSARKKADRSASVPSRCAVRSAPTATRRRGRSRGGCSDVSAAATRCWRRARVPPSRAATARSAGCSSSAAPPHPVPW